MEQYMFIYDIKDKKVISDCSLQPTSVHKKDQAYLWARNNKYIFEDLDSEKIGKWMIFVLPKFVNSLWKKVKIGIKEGHLFSAKVSTSDPENKNHVIMIYTKDYTDINDVINVLDYLEAARIKLRHFVIRYKTDQQTRAGIYSGGKQKPWIYESSTIRDLKK